MSDVQKLFTCTSPDCNMSFTDEDHLAIHRKKHDMVLNLENNGKNTGFVADQTPTPTRFIRNCEEVGLFQDLQNVNPFEETFRRAVEARNTGALTVTGEVESTDDTLHTPHIFPHIADVLADGTHILSETNQECTTPIAAIDKTTSKEKSSVETQTCSELNLHLSETHLMKDNTLTSSKTASLHAESIVLQHLNISVSPKKAPLQSSSKLSINGEEVELLLKTADGKVMQLSATPVCDSSHSSNLPSSHISTTEHVRQHSVLVRAEPSPTVIPILEQKKILPSRMTLAKMKLQQVLTKKVGSANEKSPELPIKRDITPSSTKENQKRSTDQHKKKELLERNRASSMRARAKRKAWIQHLQKTVTNANEINAALQLEVKTLRTELTRLKTLLLAHKDCPVTEAMQKGTKAHLLAHKDCPVTEAMQKGTKTLLLGHKACPVVQQVNGVLSGAKIILNLDTVDATGSVNASTIKTLTTFTPDVPTKKIALASSMKNPVILPKVEQGSITTPIISSGTIVKNIPTIKIVDVGHFMADKEEAKQNIMIVQNTTKKSEEAQPRRKIIKLNPNYEMKQTSSKSTSA